MAKTTERDGAEARVGHEVVDHTSEITLRLHAPTFVGLVEEATRAFGELVPMAVRRQVAPEMREFEVEGVDRTAVLVHWLNEIVYLCEAEQWLPVEIDEVTERDRVLHIRASGASLARPFVLVKAATLHRARIEEQTGGLSVEVTLDV